MENQDLERWAHDLYNWTRAEILAKVAHYPVRDLNRIIYELNRICADKKRSAYDLATLIGFFTDEVRRRAEELEKAAEVKR